MVLTLPTRFAKHTEMKTYTSGEFARLIGTSRQTVVSWCGLKKLKAERVGCEAIRAGYYFRIPESQLARGRALVKEIRRTFTKGE